MGFQLFQSFAAAGCKIFQLPKTRKLLITILFTEINYLFCKNSLLANLIAIKILMLKFRVITHVRCREYFHYILMSFKIIFQIWYLLQK